MAKISIDKYAVIRIKGNQFRVSEGDEILVDYLDDEKPTCEVLLIKNDSKLNLGNPVVKNAKISLKVLEPLVKGEKITVRKYKAKSRYRKVVGFRPKYSKILIEQIS